MCNWSDVDGDSCCLRCSDSLWLFIIVHGRGPDSRIITSLAYNTNYNKHTLKCIKMLDTSCAYTYSGS